MQEKRHDRVVEMRLCFFSGKVSDYKMMFLATRKCRSTLYLYGGRKLMTSEIKDILENMTTAAPEMEDYIGEDGLLYCGKCHTPI